MPLAAIIQGTPIWVWVLLVYLLSRGFKAMNSGTAPLSKLAIVPLIFTAWGILHLITDPLAGWSSVIVWVVGALIGIAGGVFIASRTRFIVDPAANTVMLPGSMVPLVLIVITFAAKFWLGVELATATSLAALGGYVLLSAAVSGVVAGVFGGRFLTYWRAMSARRVLRACSQGV
ncbi:DUF6622 family protein [Paraburkholderia sabiae]|uniref:DUF6622 family protein n=1 Tax=Paraburkholderia sabiae TaxID=273251 RepID=A0ABU9Q5Z4_9BURK|nr:DUF6622 family protein [Paraburkholderia sabiae]WJZ78210.1 hypothetical protein QEN71_29905 [Paraburkholderia sabiae]CAD6528513.1 hypothetical protein LMG24235_02168 [Paraburkholderia sabiae]